MSDFKYYPGEPKEYTLDQIVDRLNDGTVTYDPVTKRVDDADAANAIRDVSRGTADVTWYDTGGSGGPIFVYENDRSLYQRAQNADINRMICIDPVNGSDAGDGTPASPKRTARPSLWTGAVTNFQGADALAFKRGTNYVHDGGEGLRLTGPNRHIMAYGDPRIPRPKIQSSQLAAAGPYTISVEDNNCSVSDVDVDASLNGGDKSAIIITNGTREADLHSVIVQNVRGTGVTSTLSGSYPNIVPTVRNTIRVIANNQLASRTTPYNTVYDVDIINVEGVEGGCGNFSSSGCVGKWINGVLHGVRFTGCKSLGSGSQADALGFTSFGMRILRDIFPTFVQVGSSTTYYFNTDVAGIYGASVAVPDVEMLYLRVGSSTWYMRKNITAPTSPLIGEFGFDVTTQRVYVNAGSALPTGAQTTNWVDICAFAAKGLVYNQCLAKNTRWPGTTSVHEGHGIAFDDFTSDSIVMNSELIDNDGMGVSFNRGVRNLAINNRFKGNKHGAMAGLTLGAKAYGNWVEENSYSGLSGSKGVVSLLAPVYKFDDMPNRVGGFRRLAYTGTDSTGYLVHGSDNFECPSVLFDNSVVDPGVASVHGLGVGLGGYVLGRGLTVSDDNTGVVWSSSSVGV